MACAETVRDPLLPAETTVHKKLLSTESRDRKKNHADNLGRKLFLLDSNLGKNQIHAEDKTDGQSQQEGKLAN